MTPALVRSRRRSRPSGHRRERRTEGLRPSEPPLNLPAIRHTAHGTIRGAVVVAPLTPFHVCQIHSRLGQGKGRWSKASIDPCSSLVYPIARRVNSAIRERGFRDPHSRNSPPPWSRIATLTRLLEPSAPASRFGYGCGGAVGGQLHHRRAQILAHLRS